ncbi:MAG: hypothetical protein PHG05_03080 [Candidatus Nanoarchaeia archaeon]|nr:hypothetical protein [Candidatus Nanoarchaeia archaeon]
MYNKLSKKGISPLIATVLLVGFIIVILLIALVWAKNYVQERAAKEGKLAEKKLECENLDFSVTSAQKSGSNIRIVLKNLKDDNIEKWSFRIEGNKAEIKQNYEMLEGLEIKPYEIEYDSSKTGDAEKVAIIPWLKVVPGYYVPCSGKNIVARV